MRSRAVPLFAALLLAAALAGCTTNPVTGRQVFTGFLSEAGEAEIGSAQHAQVLADSGGEYDDAALTRYVQALGVSLVAASDRPDRHFTFTILDTPIVNAFALPGGYVYVTRGLLAMASNEAELAGVLAHEIGHVAARHAAERYGRAVLASLGIVGLGATTAGMDVARLSRTGGGPYAPSYSREQEYEADLLGVRYLSRTRHDPAALSTMLEKLRRQQRLEARVQGRGDADPRLDMSATHPRTTDRVARAIAAARENLVADPELGAEDYLRRIDGLVYGDQLEDGLVRGRSFAHPRLALAFVVPPGFRIVNGARSVFARGPDGATILFDRADGATEVDMGDYLRRLNLGDVEPLWVNGLPAATGVTRVQTDRGPTDMRVVALRYDPETVYRFIFMTPVAQTALLSEELRRTTYSFRRLDSAEAAALRPLRIRIVTVQPGDTVASLAARMAVSNAAEDRFRILNGLAEGAEVMPGALVKLVSE